MRVPQIEAWALRVVERVENGQPHEDVQVELKASWIDPQKAARQIAGHANAARGQPILWLIGVDQERGVVGASREDLADWYAQVQANFDTVSPSITDLNIEHDGNTFVAILFETERIPFVVINPRFGGEAGVAISHEVPWREGTSTRTARRSDLLKLLIPLLGIPEMEVMAGDLTVAVRQDQFLWHIKLQTYVVPEMGTTVAFPFHRSEISVAINEAIQSFPLDAIRMTPPYRPVSAGGMLHSEPDTFTVAHTQNEAIIQGPGQLNLYGEAWTKYEEIDFKPTRAMVQVRILPTHVDVPISFSVQMGWREPDQHHLAAWVAQ
jgi:hypothetical protein